MNQHKSGLEVGLELRPEDRDVSHQRVNPDLRELGRGGDQRCTGGQMGVETGAEVVVGAWIGLAAHWKGIRDVRVIGVDAIVICPHIVQLDLIRVMFIQVQFMIDQN
jgi:hypothetical protein